MPDQKQRYALAALLIAVLCGGGWAAFRANHASESSDQPIIITTPAGAAPIAQPVSTATPIVATQASTGDGASAAVPVSSPSPIASPAIPSDPTAIYVHVAGAVKKPNVYKMHDGARVFQAIDAAGGAKDTASLDSINLAEKVTDGEKLYIPTRAEARALDPPTTEFPTSDTSNAVSASSASSAGSAASGHSRESHGGDGDKPDKLTSPSQGVIHLNSATEEQLERLPGVGPATAARILAHRHEIGGFKKIEDLMDCGGIGDKKFAKIAPFVRL